MLPLLCTAAAYDCDSSGGVGAHLNSRLLLFVLFGAIAGEFWFGFELGLCFVRALFLVDSYLARNGQFGSLALWLCLILALAQLKHL